MIVAVSTGIAILALVGLALGLLAALLVVNLFTNIVRSAIEIESYAEDILDTGVAISKNVDGLDGLTRTRELTGAVPGLATAYLEQIGGELRR